MEEKFKFSCPQCSQKVRVYADMAGERVHCPTCGLEQTVPVPYGDPSLTSGASTSVLFVANNPTHDYAIRAMLENSGCTVHCRNTEAAAKHYLGVQKPDLVIVDHALGTERGLSFCKAVRGDSAFTDIPIFLIGEDGEGSPLEIQAFQAGVDEFVRMPIVPLVFLARVRHLIRRNLNQAISAALKVQVSAKELPGILQYLDAEKKTGHLTIGSGVHSAFLTIFEGALVNAQLDGVSMGPEVVTDILLWPTVSVTMKEEDLGSESCVFSQRFNSILMKAVVEVDELNNMKKNLPTADAILVRNKGIDGTLDKGAVRLHALAMNGHSVNELIDLADASERQAITWLDALIKGEHLSVLRPPFSEYESSCRKTYANAGMDTVVSGVRNVFADIPAPIGIGAPIDSPPDQPNWQADVPQIFVVGDSADHVRKMIDSLGAIYASVRSADLFAQQVGVETVTYRLSFAAQFDADHVVEIVSLPAIGRRSCYKDLEMAIRKPLAVVHLATAQDLKTCADARRLHRVIHKHFRGVYYHVLPRVSGADGKVTYKISCEHCGCKLAVDVEEAGFHGECGVCSRSISIPDSVHNLTEVLHLPEALPVVPLDVTDPTKVRDLFVMLFDSVIRLAKPFNDGNKTSHGAVGELQKLRASKPYVEPAETMFLD